MSQFKFSQTEIPGVLVIEPTVFGDERGYFMETYQKDLFAAAGIGSDGPSDEVLAVEEALQDLERDYPRQARVVTLTFFGGMTAPEVAEALGLSTRTVERDWRFARSWLNAWFAEPKEGT